MNWIEVKLKYLPIGTLISGSYEGKLDYRILRMGTNNTVKLKNLRDGRKFFASVNDFGYIQTSCKDLAEYLIRNKQNEK